MTDSNLETNSDTAPELIAYRLGGATLDEDLWAAPIKRAWMEAMPEKFANRCLPLLIANQSGWLLINTETVRLSWDGNRGLDAVQVDYVDQPVTPMVVSHFGAGIVTWQVPYLFRTSPGWNLLVRGPANCPMDGLSPLEGVVETDWTASSFTMNWQLTRPGATVTFLRGEPFAMIVPQRRGELEQIRVGRRDIDEAPELGQAFDEWSRSRTAFLKDQKDHKLDAHRQGWQRHYFQGRELSGSRYEQHQTRLRLHDFVEAVDGVDGADELAEGVPE